jgi:hypothetical protein
MTRCSIIWQIAALNKLPQGFAMLKRVLLAALLVICAFAIACAYVGGVASLTDRIVQWFRPGPQLAPPGTMAGADWELYAETEHFRYHVRPGDHIPSWAMKLAEDYLRVACQTLDIEPPATVPFYKHPSQLDLYETTGSRSTGVTMAGSDGQGQEVHSVHGYDPHEVMHALAHQTMGHPPAFFDEGLATAFGWDWTPGERDVHQRATSLLDQERIVPLRRLLTDWDFRSYKAYPAYSAAGSFVKFLLANYGEDRLASMFTLDRYSQLEAIEERFSSVYSRSIYQVEEDWLTALGSGILRDEARRPVVQDAQTSLVPTGLILFASTFVAAVVFIVAGERLYDTVARWLRSLSQTISARLGPSVRD